MRCNCIGNEYHANCVHTGEVQASAKNTASCAQNTDSRETINLGDLPQKRDLVVQRANAVSTDRGNTEPMKFRFHRATLDDSMETVVDFRTREDLFELLKAEIDYLGEFDIDDISVRHYGYDKRINWDTHIVKIKDIPIGFSNGMVE